jgi:hypothetical protein
MRKHHVLVLALAAMLSLGAGAQPVTPPAASAQQEGVQPWKPTTFEVEQMRGTFKLSNGREMSFMNRRARLYAEFDGRMEEMLPVAKNTFVTRDSHTRIAFDDVPFGFHVTITPGNPQTAQLDNR